MFARPRSDLPFGSVLAPSPDGQRRTIPQARAGQGATMLDPKETKKGGFGAFAQRDRERREAEAEALKPKPAPAAQATPPETPSKS